MACFQECCDFAQLLDDPKTCALYLADAFESGDPKTIAAALREVGRANHAPVEAISGDIEMSLSELLAMLAAAELTISINPIESR